jgi:carboxylesterase
VRGSRAPSRSTPTSSPRADVPAGVDGFALGGTRPLGCLLLHGFTATPDEVRPLGDALATAGFPVRAARLAGHATTPSDLARTTWRDWLGSAEVALTTLRAETSRTVVAGISLGALLALVLAARRPREVAAVVCCATPLRLRDRRLDLLRSLGWLPPPVQRRYVNLRKGQRDISDPDARAGSRSYDVIPLPALLSLMRLRGVARRVLPQVTQPAMLLHGRTDHVAPVSNLELLRRRLGSRHVEWHVLDRSWHIVTEDVERELVARLTIDFLTRVEGS